MTIHCSFYILNRDSPEDSPGLYVRSPAGSGLILEHPPAVGDLIYLSGDTQDPDNPDDEENLIRVHGAWRVLARDWTPAAYGSAAWQHGDRATTPILMQVMVERTEGLFSAVHYAAPATATP